MKFKVGDRVKTKGSTAVYYKGTVTYALGYLACIRWDDDTLSVERIRHLRKLKPKPKREPRRVTFDRRQLYDALSKHFLDGCPSLFSIKFQDLCEELGL